MYRANEVSVPLESKFPFLLSSVEWVYFADDDDDKASNALIWKQERKDELDLLAFSFISMFLLGNWKLCECDNWVFWYFPAKNRSVSKKPNISVNLFHFRYVFALEGFIHRGIWYDDSRINFAVSKQSFWTSPSTSCRCVLCDTVFCVRLETNAVWFVDKVSVVEMTNFHLEHKRCCIIIGTWSKSLHALACKSTPNDRQPFISISPLYLTCWFPNFFDLLNWLWFIFISFLISLAIYFPFDAQLSRDFILTFDVWFLLVKPILLVDSLMKTMKS